MTADRADLRRAGADDDVAAVGALPDAVAVPAEYKPFPHVRQQLAVALLVGLFDGPYALKQPGDFVKTLLRASSAMVAYMSVHS